MKRYNMPHRSRVVKTRLTDEEYADFTARLAPYGMSQSEFIRQAITRATIRPIVTVSPVNDGDTYAISFGKQLRHNCYFCILRTVFQGIDKHTYLYRNLQY